MLLHTMHPLSKPLYIVVSLFLLLSIVGCTSNDPLDDFYVTNTNLAKEDTARLAIIKAELAVIKAELAAAKVELFNSAEIFLFPEATNRWSLIGANASANNFDGWIEIKDNTGAALSSNFTAKPGYIEDIYLYAASSTNASQLWIIELAYGDNKTNIGRLMIAPLDVNAAQIKSRRIPAGEKIYYRAMSNLAPIEYLSVGFRYFYE